MDEFDPNAAAAPDSGVFGLPGSPEESAIVLIPVPWEATASWRGGTAGGPAAILAASRQIDLYDLKAGRAYEAGIAMLDEPKKVRRWNRRAREQASKIIECAGLGPPSAELVRALARVDDLSGRLNRWVEKTARRWLNRGKIVGVVGGDHSTPFGAIKALAARCPGFGLLHLDAHADLRRTFEGFRWSHASIMDNVLEEVPQVTRLVQVGVRDFCEEEHDRARAMPDRVTVYFDADLQEGRFGGRAWPDLSDEIVGNLPHDVYVSFDVDALDASLCPHTGTPVPGGLSFDEAVWLIATVVRSGRRIVGFDLCEVAPGSDGTDWDANVGARLLYKMCLWAIMGGRQGG
ncbi:MAG: agmatinase family protein [Candidatus Riflebacteria bacterium]|nr:agmatinase family protein [Candidatus Riflebacteria bacterium]